MGDLNGRANQEEEGSKVCGDRFLDHLDTLKITAVQITS